MDVLQQPVEGEAVDSQSNATATASIAGVAGFKWRVTAVFASYSGAAVGTPTRATLVAGGVTRGRGVSTSDGWQQTFVNPMEGADGAAVSLSLPAGGVGAVGDVCIQAIKIPTLPSGIKV